jgi:hypothetical protein
VLFVVAAGIAYATIPDSNGVYTACRLNNVGTIRLVDPSLPPSNLQSHCTSLETRITWNQQGQPGPQGPQGPTGAPGLPGPAGPELVVSGLVYPDGTLFLGPNASPGTSVTVTHTGTGQYALDASGLTSSYCPFPTLTPYGGAFDLYFNGGVCNQGFINTVVYTGDGQDHFWSFTIVGPGPSGGAAAAARMSAHKAGANRLTRKLLPASQATS